MAKGDIAMSYAVYAVYHHPRETWPQQKQFLHDRIVPMTKSQPGFLSGTWSYERNESKSVGWVVFDTEANARSLQTFMREEATRPNPFGVTPVVIEVVEVLAEARGA